MTSDELELLEYYIQKVEELEEKVEELKDEAAEVFAYLWPL
jgi:uncharacterized protein (UPF0335 family)